MWLGSDLIGVVLSSKTSSVKPDKWYQSRWLISTQTSAVWSLYRKSSWQRSQVRVPGKACPVKNNGGTEKGRKGVLVVGNAFAGGRVYQCG